MMTVFTEKAAYELFDQALDNNPDGIEIDCGTRNEAINLRYRLNNFRKKDREANKEIYKRDHPMHGCSAYDVLELIIPKENDTLIYIRYRPTITFSVRRVEPAPKGA